MKKYIKPEVNVVNVQLTNALLGISGKSLGEEYNSNDVDYTHIDNSWDIWGTGDDDWDE
ncbi:MAG: hypothetical protein J5671_02110 [Bacteroidaceae bacterium]|nr:hypothetical protein [Bacteroidaceae bacterium]